MTVEQLRKALKEGKAVAKKLSPVYIKVKDGKLATYRKSDDEFDYTIYSLCFNVVDLLLKDKTPYEIYEKPILDKVERKYLSDVIRPFRKDYKITISKKSVIDAKEYLCISVKKIPSVFSEFILLPCFKKDSMYKGMERDKEYSLEELGL